MERNTCAHAIIIACYVLFIVIAFMENKTL